MPARNRTSDSYGTAHRREAARLKREMRDGHPCARGGEQMYRWQLELPRTDPRSIHADHVGTPRALGGKLPDGLTCAHHNMSHGARLGHRLKEQGQGDASRHCSTPSRALAAVPVTSREW